ncbi:DUF4230 domain-containing protein [Ilyomonas limi]|uniref:DUF4230 domain-containing protein n=1 Tax=Ilyomonas limi TaxID=2575867 RepID=UPI001485984B|nr:DUF4230 domain-containing protein [Ilyomonas limi]
MLILLIALLLFASACRQKEKERDLPATILAIQQTGKLATAEYTLTKIIRASDDQTWYKIGDRKILMHCEAHLKAGIDLQQVSRNNFEVEGDSLITVTLPHAQLFSIAIPPNKIQVAYQDIGLLRDPFSAAEREQLLAQAEQQIRKLATSLGILQTAETNAVTYIQHLLQQVGYKHVSVIFE